MKIFVRFVLYLAGCSLVTGAAMLLLYWFGYRAVLKEDGPIEWLEALWLLLSSLFLFLAARNSTKYARLFAVLWLLPLATAVRELDAVFDRTIFHGAWFIPAVFILSVAFYRAFKSRSILKSEILDFVQTQQAVFLGLGFFIVVAFAQLCGQQAVMRAVFQEHYLRSIGGFVEEVIEFLGYIILVVGSLECYLRCHRFGRAEE
jgi:hypothetical protein